MLLVQLTYIAVSVVGRSTRSLGINMPLWVAGYLGFYVAFSIWSLVDDYRSGQRTQLAGSAVSDILLLVPAIAFWMPEVHAQFASVLALFFWGGLATFGVLMVVALRRHVVSDPELSFREKWGVGLVGSIAALFVSAPVIFWAFRAAVMEER